MHDTYCCIYVHNIALGGAATVQKPSEMQGSYIAIEEVLTAQGAWVHGYYRCYIKRLPGVFVVHTCKAHKNGVLLCVEGALLHSTAAGHRQV